MNNLFFSQSIFIRCSPQALYDILADVTRTGEWSPTCRACWWDEGAGPWPGAWFTGRNETSERTWETRSQVIVAEPGREFSFVVGEHFVRWSYLFTRVDGGTHLTESWQFLPAGIAWFHERHGSNAEARIRRRTEDARRDIPATLAAIKAIAEVL